MGGFRTDGKLLESLQEAVEVLYREGHDTLSDDVEEAIERLSAIYPEPAHSPEHPSLPTLSDLYAPWTISA